MATLVAMSDYSIIRDGATQNTTVIHDCDGNYLFSVPPSFSDDDIKAVVRVANGVYSNGYEYGMKMKQIEIKTALGWDTVEDEIEELRRFTKEHKHNV